MFGSWFCIKKSDANIAGGSGDSEHSAHSQNVVRPNCLDPSEGTSHLYVSSAHIHAVINRILWSVFDTGYRRRVAIAIGAVPTRQDDN